MFGVVGTVGVGVNTAVLWLGHSVLGLYYLVAAVVATETAIIHNFFGHELITFAGEGEGRRITRFAKFQAISLTTIGGTVTILWILVRALGKTHLLVWNLVAIATMFVANFLLNRAFTWARPGQGTGGGG